MKPRDFAFLLSGLVLGVLACAMLFPRPAISAPPSPVALQAPAAVPATAPTTDATSDTALALGGKVYLAGDVHTQGAFEIRPQETVTVSQAIALAGGLAPTGDRQRIKLMRRLPDGSSVILPVDLKLSESGYVKDPAVQPGDLINVPEKLANF